jgi:acyl-CoA thioesterase-1
MLLSRWILSTVLLLFACSSDTGPTAPGPAQPPGTPQPPGPTVTPVVVALGDSLTEGPELLESEAWPALIQERIRAAALPHVVVNAGISDETTADGLARLDRELVPDTAVLIVALGANDGIRRLPISDVERNLATIIERARSRNIGVLLAGMEAVRNHGLDYSLQFHEIYPSLASRYDVPLMPFLLAGVFGRPELNLADGLHPNAAGMRVIAENLWPYLHPLLR